jgi:hypothetical protein
VTLPLGIFSFLIYIALAVVVAAPVILLVLWIRDSMKGDLW